MQYSTMLLSAFAATACLAAPARRQDDGASIDVRLSNQAIELGSGTSFEEDQLPQTKPPTGSSGPFDTVVLALGPDVENADLRCQLLDANHDAIAIVRNGVTQITFADGGEQAPWTFLDGATEVSSIVCDPDFSIEDVVAAVLDLDVRVQLSDGNLARQQAFEEAGLVREEQDSPDDESLFNTVSLILGVDVVNQDLRCQILDMELNPIEVLRAGNLDTTFANGDPWTFDDVAVSTIICDPEFEKAA